MSVVVCTDLSSKEPHRQVGVGTVVSDIREPTRCNGCTLTWNCTGVGSIPPLGKIFPIFITPMTYIYINSAFIYTLYTYICTWVYILLRALPTHSLIYLSTHWCWLHHVSDFELCKTKWPVLLLMWLKWFWRWRGQCLLRSSFQDLGLVHPGLPETCVQCGSPSSHKWTGSTLVCWAAISFLGRSGNPNLVGSNNDRVNAITLKLMLVTP